jgi:hypothetical protein
MKGASASVGALLRRGLMFPMSVALAILRSLCHALIFSSTSFATFGYSANPRQLISRS